MAGYPGQISPHTKRSNEYRAARTSNPGTPMTTYFDNLTHQIKSSDLPTAIHIEAQVVDTVSLACGDREFPADMRNKIMEAIAIWQMCPCYAPTVDHPQANHHSIRHYNICGTSILIATLHNLFHDLARQHIPTRFGLLTDDPSEIVRTRDQHDTEQEIT